MTAVRIVHERRLPSLLPPLLSGRFAGQWIEKAVALCQTRLRARFYRYSRRHSGKAPSPAV
ncbi:hypothetical protein BXY39_2154 [Eilatimonas milleporae]|uniref:Uncharacterized protein n=1 Tax=Eilatimonas milleporae TaxID=911205 RepID=A0A3M0CE90_9PROT|nr:hypothetical protein BXY39_2154 [Eilatimonas milleporae]